MRIQDSRGGIPVAERNFWYTGFDYNATYGSRAAVNEDIVTGSVFCLDPELTTDHFATAAASRTSGLSISGSRGTASSDGTELAPRHRHMNVTKPASGITSLFAGVYVGPTIPAADTAKGIMLPLVVAGFVNVKLDANSDNVTFGDTLLPQAASWDAVEYAAGSALTQLVGSDTYDDDVAAGAVSTELNAKLLLALEAATGGGMVAMQAATTDNTTCHAFVKSMFAGLGT